MKRPWHIWFCYGLCLLIVLPAMAWLTVKARQLDHTEAQARTAAESARRQAELQELVGSALWRMDWTLTPLIAQETARPYFVYQPFYDPAGDGPSSLPGRMDTPAPVGAGGENSSAPVGSIASPLLMQPSDYVLLHFQVTPDDVWTSPQNPTGPLCTPALQCGATLDNIHLSGRRLDQLRDQTNYRQLLSLLPERLLPLVTGPDGSRDANPLLVDPLQDAAVVNDLGFAQLQEPSGPRYGANEQREFPQSPAEQAESPSQQAAPTPQQSPSQQRGGNQWQQRNRAYQAFATNEFRQLRTGKTTVPAGPLVREGVSRPLWVGDQLLLARRVVYQNRTAIQGCWLDWPRIEAILLQQIEDLVPEAELRPLHAGGDAPPGRVLATLPVHLVVDADAIPDLGSSAATRTRTTPSALTVALIVAWVGLLLAAAAVAVLLRGVLALSERRAAFVSSVTHELRTPLTTFRMYAEMLATGMVPGPREQAEYLETLRKEAERLTHLVDNVLLYARLERSRPRRKRRAQPVALLVEKVRQRLAERAEQAGMQVDVELPDPVKPRQVLTDSAAVEQILFNLVDNACKYAATAEDCRIQLKLTTAGNVLEIAVIDHGPGLSREVTRRLFRPFSKSADEAARSAAGVGLGLALCRRLAHDLGGRLVCRPPAGRGAGFVLQLPLLAGAPFPTEVEPASD